MVILVVVSAVGMDEMLLVGRIEIVVLMLEVRHCRNLMLCFRGMLSIA